MDSLSMLAGAIFGFVFGVVMHEIVTSINRSDAEKKEQQQEIEGGDHEG